jgi:hypothetical protein
MREDHATSWSSFYFQELVLPPTKYCHPRCENLVDFVWGLLTLNPERSHGRGSLAPSVLAAAVATIGDDDGSAAGHLDTIKLQDVVVFQICDRVADGSTVE